MTDKFNWRRLVVGCVLYLIGMAMMLSGPVNIPVVGPNSVEAADPTTPVVAAITSPTAATSYSTDQGYIKAETVTAEPVIESEEIAPERVVPVAERTRPVVRAVVVSRGEPRAYIDDLVPESFRPLLLEVVKPFQIDPRMVAAVVSVESEWTVRAKGRHNDLGLMQIIPTTAEWIAGSLGMAEFDLFDARTNLTMGTWYLKVLFDEYGEWPKALAAYNGGPKAAHRGAEHPYAAKVLGVYRGR